MDIKPGDKIKIIKEYGGYPNTLGKIFTVHRLIRLEDGTGLHESGGIYTVEKDKEEGRYIICGDEYEKILIPRQLTFIFHD